MVKRLISCFITCFSFLLYGQVFAAAASTEVIVFHAGSLTGPYQKAARAYEALHPEVKIVLEGSGSREAARKVSDLKRPCDIVASADYETIDTLLKPAYADFNIFFARNKSVLAFTDKSKYADEINAANWYQILARPDVQYGHTDPNLDPGGYRAVLTLKLAETYYNELGLYQQLVDNFHVENMLNDGKEIQARLRSGQMDYFFLYESSAKQGGFRYVTFPEQIDFSSMEYADYYQQATLELTGKAEGSFITVKGQPIVYGLTLVNNAPHREEALKFLRFMLTDGQQFLNQAGFIAMDPPQVRAEEIRFIPEELQDLVKPL